MSASRVGTPQITGNVEKRQGEKAAKATINGDLALLRRAFSLGLDREPIEGHSRWLPNNAIEVTLKITENDDTKRTETILLERFEPKTLVLREDPARGGRELLRLIPVSKRVMEGNQIDTLP